MEQQRTQNKTGYNGDQDILKNIYDLEGNWAETTVEAYSANGRTNRGANYSGSHYSYFFPASHRDLGDDIVFNWGSPRSVLYIKL